MTCSSLSDDNTVVVSVLCIVVLLVLVAVLLLDSFLSDEGEVVSVLAVVTAD